MIILESSALLARTHTLPILCESPNCYKKQQTKAQTNRPFFVAVSSREELWTWSPSTESVRDTEPGVSQPESHSPQCTQLPVKSGGVFCCPLHPSFQFTDALLGLAVSISPSETLNLKMIPYMSWLCQGDWAFFAEIPLWCIHQAPDGPRPC